MIDRNAGWIARMTMRTKGVLQCGYQDLANAIDGCLKMVKTKEPDAAGAS